MDCQSLETELYAEGAKNWANAATSRKMSVFLSIRIRTNHGIQMTWFYGTTFLLKLLFTPAPRFSKCHGMSSVGTKSNTENLYRILH